MKKECTEKASRPQLVKLDKALKLAEKWVNEMSKTSEDDTTKEELQGRPLRLGLGAKVPRQQQMGPVNDPVERKLREKLRIGKRKADQITEKDSLSARNGDGEDEEDENLDSRTYVFVKKKALPLNPFLQSRKKK